MALTALTFAVTAGPFITAISLSTGHLTLGETGRINYLDGHVLRLERSYPAYRRGYRQHVETVVEHLESLEGLTVIGRYGAFKYNNQDHSILMGILAADNIAPGAQHALWSIITDYEPYQEAASTPYAQRQYDRQAA